jgi:hypothetical protein
MADVGKGGDAERQREIDALPEVVEIELADGTRGACLTARRPSPRTTLGVRSGTPAWAGCSSGPGWRKTTRPVIARPRSEQRPGLRAVHPLPGLSVHRAVVADGVRDRAGRRARLELPGAGGGERALPLVPPGSPDEQAGRRSVAAHAAALGQRPV